MVGKAHAITCVWHIRVVVHLRPPPNSIVSTSGRTSQLSASEAFLLLSCITLRAVLFKNAGPAQDWWSKAVTVNQGHPGLCQARFYP